MTPWTFTPYALPLLGSAIVAALLGAYACRKWAPTPGAKSFVVVMGGVAGWSLVYALEVSATDFDWIYPLHQLTYVAIVTIPGAWLAFGLRYARAVRFSRLQSLALAIEPLLMLASIWTNSAHHLVWLAPGLDTSDGQFTFVSGGHGVAYWFHVAYSYLLIMLGTAALGRALLRMRHLFAWQRGLMIASVIVPWVANVAGLLGWGPLARIDATPIAFLVACATLAWGLFYLRFLDIVPIAHDAIFESMADAALVLDGEGRVIDLNPTAERLVGRSAGTIIGRRLDHLASGVTPGTPLARAVEHILARLEDLRLPARQFELTLDPQSSARSFDVQLVALRRGRADNAGTLLMLRDTTARRRLLIEEAEQRSEARYRALVQHSSDLIALLAPDGTVHYHSPAIEQVLGYAADEYIGQNVMDMLHPEDAQRALGMLRELQTESGKSQINEWRLKHHDGTWRRFESIATNHLENASVAGIVVNLRDITQRKELESQLAHQALHDPLTGLPNRALFLDRLEHAQAAAARRNKRVAVFYLDLDDFKLVNDSLGHDAGDELLKVVADRLLASLRAEDTAARLGGDEFTILLEDIPDSSAAVRVVEALEARLAEPIILRGRSVAVHASVGIALGEPTDTPGDLLRKADLAMYDAKASGRGGYCLFDPMLAAAARDQLELLADLPRALARSEFRLHYQPMVDMVTGEIREVEALVRWQHPRRGLLLPGEFISLAESSGLIVPIGRWVLAEACRQLAEWRTHGSWLGDVTMNVNLSPRQLRDPELVESVRRALRDAAIDPQQLRLEITEGLAMENVELSISVLWMLNSLGVRLAVDDFGTGHSSVSYLARFPVDTLKVDRSFVDAVAFDPEVSKLVRALVAFARSLGLETVAEGVETSEQMAALQAMDCQLGQGFLFSRALPPAVVERLPERWDSVATPEVDADLGLPDAA